MALNRRDAPSGDGASGVDREAAIVVERLSKSYPTSRVQLFPPVTSVFERDLIPFRRRGSAAGSEDTPPKPMTTARPALPSAERQPGARDDLDDEEDEEDEDLAETGSGRRTPWEPGEMFWALRDVSLRVSEGAAFGVLGGPAAGKSTLLGILGGHVLPTAGRALVRDPVSPLPAALAKAIGLTGKGTFDMELVLASRLLGLDPRLMRAHRDEIEAMAAPLWDEEGEPARGAMLRLATATAIVIPSKVVLLDDLSKVDEEFMQRVVERIPVRTRNGDTIVLASREPGLVADLCDEAIVLHDGSVVEAGTAAEIGRHQPAGPGGGPAVKSGATPAEPVAGDNEPGRYLSDGRPLEVPGDVPPFNGFAALLSADLRSASGHPKRVDVRDDEILLEILLETARPDIEVSCGVFFRPRGHSGPAIRVELSDPVRLLDPRTYAMVARIPPGTLPHGAYAAAADAVVANPDEPVANVIAREMGRVRFVGDGREPTLDALEYVHWDGRRAARVEAQWSVE